MTLKSFLLCSCISTSTGNNNILFPTPWKDLPQNPPLRDFLPHFLKSIEIGAVVVNTFSFASSSSSVLGYLRSEDVSLLLVLRSANMNRPASFGLNKHGNLFHSQQTDNKPKVSTEFKYSNLRETPA